MALIIPLTMLVTAILIIQIIKRRKTVSAFDAMDWMAIAFCSIVLPVGIPLVIINIIKLARLDRTIRMP
jgi:hypothetical protein